MKSAVVNNENLSRALRGQPVAFNGLSCADAKRKALNFWYVYQHELRLGIREFSSCLSLQPDGSTIIFVLRGGA
ncbi:MAG: hypothetical protein RBU37_27680 [Myxococcota bacterium]|nr:hypothetical protein [Myxococcota bacterium]